MTVFTLLLLGLGWLAWQKLDRRMIFLTPAPTLLFLDAEGRYLAEFSRDEKRQGFWPLPELLPERVVAATLAAEDARFFSHCGVDLIAVARACRDNLRHRRRISGASTLAMQVARIQAPGPRTWMRKLTEAAAAVGIIRRYGHLGVLRQYLTIAPYGNQNYGIVYAARRYLDKPPADLTWAEAALLAALPRLPGRMNIYRFDGRRLAERRAIHILNRLRDMGRITRAERDESVAQLRWLRLADHDSRPDSCLHAILAMAQDIRREPASRWAKTWTIRTTLKLDLQREVQDLARAAMEEFRPDGAGNLAALVVEKTTGRIQAYLGSEDYFDAAAKGSIDYARVPRSSGSTLKPFIYGLGLSERGYTAATLLTDSGLALDRTTNGYIIKNYDEECLGPILYRNALANSRNIPAVQVLHAVGQETAYRHFIELGLVHRWRDPRYYGLGIAIGGLYVTLEDLVRAYGVLANDGRSFHLNWFAGTPEPVPEAGPETTEHPGTRQLIPEDTARQITLFLADPLARLPSFPRNGWLEYPFPMAVKTGTSQGFRDAWCVAFSRKYIVGVWVGHPDNYPMNRRCGADSAAMLVHWIMEHLHPEESEGFQNTGFPPPRGFVSRRICLLSGKLAREDTPYTAIEWFRPGTEPVEKTNVYRELVLDTRTARPAAPGIPAEFQTRRTLVVLEPRFAAWAHQSGFELPPLALVSLSGELCLGRNPDLVVGEPRDRARLIPDPETPPEFATITLHATADPPVPQLLWYVDGQPYQVVDYPYTTRWRLQSGPHTFQVRLPSAPIASHPVHITVVR